MFPQSFTSRNPFLYHLTAQGNIKQILCERTLLSTSSIASEVFQSLEERRTFVRDRRPTHVILCTPNRRYTIRDQRPVSMKVLARSLTPGWTAGDFIKLLNGRVFFWPTIERLKRHYDRYASESPVIIRVESEELLDLNPHVELACLNTGATRCHPKYGGNAPTRGAGTFQPPNQIQFELRSIAEVTFPSSCVLPRKFWIGTSPEGPWQSV